MKYALILLVFTVSVFAKDAPQYNLTLNVTQTTQSTFTHGANSTSSTDCSAAGNNINCTTNDTSFKGFQGISYIIQATASDGNAYTLSCDAQWRWSHCMGLTPGSFSARIDGGSLAIQFHDNKGKLREGKYRIISIAKANVLP